ncbi:MAG TPA: FAD-dependent monooxygenase [Streptosporangiaceae bacterium]|jgi:2-polyprenyl-6-methoxyphenol hydroxylase-like FAD-dependent oxidoreductase
MSTTTPVLIAGAGLSGLTTALFLAHHGVPALVVDRHPGTSVAPKARGQMPTIMEPFRAAGVAEAIMAAAPPGRPEMTIQICESVTGAVMHSFTEGFPDYEMYSPAPTGMASQAKAEAAIAARAAELGAELRFNTRMESWTDGANGVRAVLTDLVTEETYEVRAEYLVAATGHRGGAAEEAGIGGHGLGAFEETSTVLFAADALIGRVPDTAILMYYMQNPGLPDGAGAFVSTDTPGEYVAALRPDEDRTDAETIALIRVLTGVPDLDVKLLGADTWPIAHRVADRFRAGRVLLVGDAAHVMPPTGGQGGNTAMLDGYRLAWKLAAVVKGQAGAGLLDSHDREWRPYDEVIANWQVANMVQRQAPHLARLRPDLPEADSERLLFGYSPGFGAFVAEPEVHAMFEDPAAPSGRPGTRAPHVPLDRDGERVSTRDLFTREFVLLSASPAARDAASAVAARLGVPIEAYVVGADLADPDGAWAAKYGVDPASGAVLVRPDGVIGWRTGEFAESGLEDALRVILDRPLTSDGTGSGTV